MTFSSRVQQSTVFISQICASFIHPAREYHRFIISHPTQSTSHQILLNIIIIIKKEVIMVLCACTVECN